MPITYTPDEIAILESGACRWAGLIRVATPDPARLWTGFGDFPVLDSAYDADGDVYRGGGRYLGMPAFQRLMNGLAERITITLSGVTDDMRALVYEEAADVRGAILRMGLVLFDETYGQVGPVRWLRRGRVDVIETSNQPGERERIKTIEFSIGSLFTGRKVPGQGTWTNADQQARPGSEDDRFCERTPLMTETSKDWPPV